MAKLKILIFRTEHFLHAEIMAVKPIKFSRI